MIYALRRWYTKSATWIKKYCRKCILFCSIFWWNRRELNPCPKINPYNFLRRQSFYWNSPDERRKTGSFRGSTLCLDRYKCDFRFKFTTHLTRGESRSPLSRHGRHYCRVSSLRCQCNVIVVVYYLSLDILTRLSGALRLSYLKTPVETIAAP